MKNRKQWLRFAQIQLVNSALWGFCPYRALEFYLSARVTFNMEKLGDSLEDYSFSQTILFCYLASYLIATALGWDTSRVHSLWLALPLLLTTLTSVYLILNHSEEDIVLFPSFSPLIALLTDSICGVIGESSPSSTYSAKEGSRGSV